MTSWWLHSVLIPVWPWSNPLTLDPWARPSHRVITQSKFQNIVCDKTIFLGFLVFQLIEITNQETIDYETTFPKFIMWRRMLISIFNGVLISSSQFLLTYNLEFGSGLQELIIGMSAQSYWNLLDRENDLT